MVEGVDLHYNATVPEADRLAASEFDMMGDITWLFPLSSQIILPYGPVIYASGVVSNVDKDRSQFDLTAEHYITFIRDMNAAKVDALKKTAGENTLIPSELRGHNASISLKSMFPDSPRWKHCEKPMPINGRYVSIHATLARVEREKVQNGEGLELEVAKEFMVNVELITFLGNAAAKLSASGSTSSVVDTPARDNLSEIPVSARKRLKFTANAGSPTGDGSPLPKSRTKRKASDIVAGGD